jgi:FixJ family two-component response regulator
MTQTGTVFVVEDDTDVRQAMARLLDAAGHAVATYESAEQYLDTLDASRPGCLLLDLRLPQRSGLDLQDELRSRGAGLPIIFLTGHGRVEDSVRAMKHGAVDFLLKPVSEVALLEAISRAMAADAAWRHDEADMRVLRERYHTLTDRQRFVVPMLVGGWLNKQIGFELGVSERTIKAHRAQIMRRMGASTLAELIAIAARLAIQTRRAPTR